MSTDLQTRARNMMMGALVADAAAMGLHWIYDQAHIQSIAPTTPEFRAPDAANYADVPGYFAHAGRAVGAQSQYGEQSLVMMRCLRQTDGRFDAEQFQSAFQTHFGYGGTYVGYIDRATRETLNNMRDADDGVPSMGSDDVQLPAIAKLPALVVALVTTNAPDAEFNATVETAVRLTNNTDVAVAYGHVAAAMMRTALTGGRAEQVIAAGRTAATDAIKADIDTATAQTTATVQDVTAQFGMACDLSYGIPSIAHNIITAPTYTDAIRRNIYGGGDTCGRSILLGAVMGAIHGRADAGIPKDWIETLLIRDEV